MTKDQAAILRWMLSEDMYLSPFKFCMTAYPWGEGDLAQFSGPRLWQKERMIGIEEYLISALRHKITKGTCEDFYREAVASGRGPGKSAFVGMMSHWFMSTRIGGSVWVAANGEPQLRTKTFPEIAKWFARGANADFFDIASTSITPSRCGFSVLKSGNLLQAPRYIANRRSFKPPPIGSTFITPFIDSACPGNVHTNG
jgi:hypothetical protein